MEKMFFANWAQVWKNKLKRGSKLVVAVSVGLSLSMFILEILNYLITGSSQKCLNVDTGVAVVCSSNFLINKMLMSYCFYFFFVLSLLDGIFNENLYELYSAMLISLLSTGYYIFRFFEPYENDFFDWIFFFISVGTQIFFIVMAFPLHNEYLWRLYRKVGADKNYRNIYRHYLIYLCILKLFVMFGMINFLTSGRGFLQISTDYSIVFDIIEFIILIAVLVIGYYAAKNEIRPLYIFYMVIEILPLGYVIYAYTKSLFYLTLEPTYEVGSIFAISVTCGVFAIGFNIMLFILNFGTLRNFGKGLRNLEFIKNQSETGFDVNDEDGEIYDFETNPGTINEDDLTVLDVIRNTYGLNSNLKH